MRRILVAIDGSECGYRAVEQTAVLFSGLPDLHLTLLHVLPYLPPSFWDNGHILSEGEREARDEVIRKWLENQKRAADPIFETAFTILKEKGIQAEAVETRAISDSTDAAESILEEARKGTYLALVVGRCGFSRPGEFLLGSTSSRIINKGAGLAICLIE